MKLSINDIGMTRGRVFTDRSGRYRKVVAATELFMVHVPCARWVEER